MTTSDIDLERVQRRLEDIWEIGRTGDGATRLAYSDEETTAIEYIVDELPGEYDVRVDDVGNVFATREPDADRSVFTGSHLDTVFDGGRLDGALGVVVSLEAIQTAYERGDPPVPPTLSVFRAEESSRFGQWAIGSRGALGQLTTEDLSATDQSNVPLWQAMQGQGLQPANLSTPSLNIDRVATFLEVHIEQGRVLDEENETLGVVSSIRGPARHRVTVEGAFDHSGATPMQLRRDAIAGGAAMVTDIEDIALEAAEDGDLVATVGEFAATRSAINKVCGEVTFSIDIRSNDTPYRDAVESRVLERIRAIATDRDLELEITPLDRSDPVALDEHVASLLRETASALDLAPMVLPSGGGHDAMNFQHAGIPTGMLFVPSIDGVSHSPDEATPETAIRDAATVLTRTLLRGPPEDG